MGTSRTAGRELRAQGDPEEVRVHDFLDPRTGKAAPYGVYDLAPTTGWVSVGIDSRHGRASRSQTDPPLVDRTWARQRIPAPRAC